mmetsp:Transcript_17545/g.25798  ORF Transcript_17545/g.25798 Transcript_17545/m.25798 type:complete len:80 (+) Transcript_17545:182-421(+)
MCHEYKFMNKKQKDLNKQVYLYLHASAFENVKKGCNLSCLWFIWNQLYNNNVLTYIYINQSSILNEFTIGDKDKAAKEN